MKTKNRRVLRRKGKNKQFVKSLNLVGANAAGLSSKFDSFDKLLSEIIPGVFFIQETKLRKEGKIKTENASKYQIYERLRKSSRGGGLALGVHHDLKPAWVGEGENEIESLSVEICVEEDFRIRCVAAYGPQEAGPSMEEKLRFWAHLDAEVQAAENNGTGFILQMDANLWAGPELIPGDPNKQNVNGKLFQQFLQRNSHLVCVNSLEMCEGLITRIRKTRNSLERSILDFFIVCDKVKPFIHKMIIDESRQHVLTNFNPIRTGGESN